VFSLFWLQLISLEQSLLILQESKFHFRLDSNQQFQGRLCFLLDQLSILWLLFVTGIGSLIRTLSATCMMTRICISILLI
jgi:NADH:ubiquinone oxidoreductase subunit 5 (subunit L)/multisubunit Na+/H+ antiporter MnhA subunit